MKNLYILLIVLVSGVFLAGCTLWGTEEKKADTGKISIVDDTPDTTPDTKPDTTPDTEELADDSTDDGTTEEPTEEPVDETPEEPAEDSELSMGQSYSGAPKSSQIRIISYEYEVVGGKMVYTWGFAGGTSALKVASYEAGYDSDNHLLVSFPSLYKDAVAKTETTTKLGASLPSLTWKPDGEGSLYKFATTAERTYTLTISGSKLTLTLNLK